MKLHRVSISNLNSLYGEHVIDFDSDLNDSIFVILGPTGAGKSTILDAISLALFGRTPRLTKSPGREETQSHNIMSYGTGRCWAAVEFSVRDPAGGRRRYKAMWDVRRAREKPSGNMQDPERSLWEIEEDGTETLLISDKRRKYYDPHFDEVLRGMTVEDFQRSMLLAQGEFAAFLRAPQEVKASILERLTNTDDYQIIGERASLKRRDVVRRVDSLKERLGGLELLTPDEGRDLEAELAETEAALESARKDAERARAVVEWVGARARIEKESEEARALVVERRERLTARADEYEALKRDRAARPAVSDLQAWDAARERRAVLDEDLKEALAHKSETTSAIDVARKKLTEATRAATKAQTEFASLEKEIAEAKRLKNRVREAQREVEAAKAKHDEAHQREEAELARVEQLRQRHAEYVEENARAESALEEVAHARDMIAHLKALRTQYDVYTNAREAVERHKEKREKERAHLDEIHLELTQTEERLSEVERALAPQREALDHARRARDETLVGATPAARRDELEQEREGVVTRLKAVEEALRLHEELVGLRREQADVKRTSSQGEASLASLRGDIERLTRELGIQRDAHTTIDGALRALAKALALVDARAKLEEDEACPLCGSSDHPFVSHGEEDGGERELREEQGRIEEEKKTLEEAITTLEERLHHAEIATVRQESSLEQSHTRTRTLRQRVEELIGRHDGARHRAGLEAIDLFPPAEQEQKERRAQLVERRGALQLDASEDRRSIA